MDWLQAVKDVGFPIVAYGAFAFAVWQTFRWLGRNVILPIQDRAFKFLDKIESNIDRVDQASARHTMILDQIKDGQKHSEEARKELIVVQREILAAIKKNGESIGAFLCKAVQ